MEIIKERYDIAIQRIREISEDTQVSKKYIDYFKKVSVFILQLDTICVQAENNVLDTFSFARLKEQNYLLYSDVYKENYDISYANPAFAAEMLGDEYGGILCFLYKSLRDLIGNAYRRELNIITLWIELFIEIYNYFENEDELVYSYLRDTIYSFEKDNSEIFVDDMVDSRINPARIFAADIVSESDLSDIRYLYKYGEHIGDNEIKMAEYLNGLSREKIDELAIVYTEGYRKGFENAGKDLSIKGTVDIRYNIGFERIVKSAIEQFEKMGLKPVIYPGGYRSTAFNKQYLYDHKFDNALYLDSAFVKRKLEVARQAYEIRKEEAALMAGPAVIEIFGENPFEPVIKKQSYSLSEKQQKLSAEYITKYQQIVQEYIKGEERSFTIIAFPIPEFGEKFQEIFEATVKINTLDDSIYKVVQQSIIDSLDKADYVRVVGKGNNKTYMNVKLHSLNNPQKETKFENCLADVNIPLGEVFTSPVLTGTNGVLHVSEVYLGELKYKDLEITFENGRITDYTCGNFETEEENRKFIKENVMHNHDTLPIGEFAIGTNTTAYVIANKYDIIYKLPILIVEKMGPHFAVGDTCYSFEEDIRVYNPDGKEIIAKDNEISINRKSDISKAYFGCHTDITIPYDELGEIVSVTEKGEEITIIKNGRFVLEGCEILNEPFETN
jgi:leucyl aminopeptidase (aminopeptidase T)